MASAAQPTTLLVDDDERFRERLAKALVQRGYTTLTAANHASAIALAQTHKPERAIVDLRMPGKGGLDVVRDVRELLPDISIVVLTGYGSIATAVEAIRLGAIDYITKPADADRILTLFEAEPESPSQDITYEVPSLARIEWEHIERVLRECNGNISRTARVLGMHRRTLQYKLAKFPTAR